MPEPTTVRRRLGMALAASLLITTVATGCGSDDDSTSSPTTGPATSTARTTTASTTTADSASGSSAPAGSNVSVSTGIVYGTAQIGGASPVAFALLLDLYLPAEASLDHRVPVVIAIHGGGFTKQSRTDPGLVRIANALAAEGIAVASIDYRLDGQEPVPSDRVAAFTTALGTAPLATAMAAAVDDTLTAIGYLQANNDTLPIDTDRLGLVGSSAGAITADHVGYTLDDHGIAAPRPKFVASLWGGLFVPPPDGMPDPSAHQLEPGEPALFAVHGDADRTVPVILDDQLVDQSMAVGVRSEYHRMPGGKHGYDESGFFTVAVDGALTPFDRLLAFAKDALA